MTQMVRKQIYIDERHNSLLKRLAKARNVSEAEVIRQALDREARTSAPHPQPGNHAAFKALYASALARRKRGQQGAPYKWRREDAYEERDARFEKFSHREQRR